MAEKKDTRVRNWSFILYPESAPNDWKKKLENLKIKIGISPLHDKDFNEGTGEVKKPHYHILLCFDGKKSYEQILEITKNLNASIPERVISPSGLIRYFVHRDNPDKAQYQIKDIVVFGDLDIISPFKTATTRYECIKEMINYIKNNGITEFQDLMDYAIIEQEEWFRYLCDNSAYIVQEYIKSCRHRIKSQD